MTSLQRSEKPRSGLRIGLARWIALLRQKQGRRVQWLRVALVVALPLLLLRWVYRVVRQKPQRLQQNHVVWLEFSPDGNWLAAGDHDGITGLWNLATRRHLVNLGGYAVFSPDGKKVVMGNWGVAGAARHYLWDLPRNRPIKGLKVAAIETMAQAWEQQRVKLIRTGVRGEPGLYWAARWPDGRLLACGRGGGEILRLWDATTGKLLQTFKEHSGPPLPMAFSRDATTLACYGYQHSGRGQHSVVRVWDIHSGQLLREIDLWFGPYLSLALSPDGRTLAIGDDGGTIELYRIR